MNGIAAQVDVTRLNRDVLRRIFVFNRKTVVVDRRVACRYRVIRDDGLLITCAYGNIVADGNVADFS